MFRWIVGKKLKSAEKDLGVSLDYLRHILKTSWGLFWNYVKFSKVSQYRKKLPPEPYHVARIVADRNQDCGECVQIGVNLAKKDRISPEILRAVVFQKPEDLPQDLQEVYRFTEAVVNQTGEDVQWRDKLRQRYGEEAFIELCTALSMSLVYPVVKRALGYAVSCSRVQIQI